MSQASVQPPVAAPLVCGERRSPDPASAAAPLLSVRDLAVEFRSETGPFRAVDGVSFDVAPGEVLGIVGESGCGKSVTSLAMMGLLPRRVARIAGGHAAFEGRDLLTLAPEALRRLRGRRMAMIFQEPMSSLTPVHSIGDQIAEAIRAHEAVGRRDARRRAIELLDRVGIPAAASRVESYPHELSGGMRQRVMIAMALALNPALIIADEPTTALDVTIQAQILELLRDIRREYNTAIVLITHDLGVVAELAERVTVMYAGRVVETAPIDALFARPEHPYTVGLLASIPALGARRRRLPTIPGTVPNLHAPPPGCRFAPRCPFAQAPCHETDPSLMPLAPGHLAACLRAPLARSLTAEPGR